MTAQNTDQPAQAKPAASLWMLGPWQDLVLFVGTPILILPLVFGLGSVVAAVTLNKWVLALGAMGHHLPGMMRAYGDQALFQRFKTRLILSPLILGGLCILYAVKGWHGMICIAYAWGIWHGLMQTHGFARLYDSRRGSFARSTAWCDLALTMSWFLGGVVWSDYRMEYFAKVLRQSGGPIIGAGQIATLQGIFGVAMVAATLAFAINSIRETRRGVPPSPAKLLLLATSIGFWWYACVGVKDILIGMIVFELFHDVQYLAIVWIFNRKRVESGAKIGPVSRFLFQPSFATMMVYLGLIFLYGSFGPITEALAEEGTRKVFAGLVTFSALLHFYFDGFIWKVRSEETREGVGVKSVSGHGVVSRAATTLGLKHGAKWTLLLIPALWLGFAESNAQGDELGRAAEFANEQSGAAAWLEVAHIAKNEKDLKKAADAFGKALEIEPENDAIRFRFWATCFEYGEKLFIEGHTNQALVEFKKAVAVEKGLSQAGPGLALGLIEEAKRFMAKKDYSYALLRCECSLLLRPRRGETHLLKAFCLYQLRRFPEATQALNRATTYGADFQATQELDAKIRDAMSSSEGMGQGR